MKPAPGIGNIRERLAGIDAAIADVPGARAEVIETSTDVTDVAQIVAAQLALQPRPTAIFTLNNVLTLGTLRATEQLGLEIPGDVSLLEKLTTTTGWRCSARRSAPFTNRWRRWRVWHGIASPS